MVKVLLIITDVVTESPQTLYMIDEYENSLGVNAIDFLPAFLADCGGDRQFIITTHHPLLVNAVPVSDWFVFHRKGLNIRVMHGAEIESRYGHSKQQRFTQLINDPLGGVPRDVENRSALFRDRCRLPQRSRNVTTAGIAR
jgi:hypothetical protein